MPDKSLSVLLYGERFLLYNESNARKGGGFMETERETPVQCQIDGIPFEAWEEPNWGLSRLGITGAWQKAAG